MSTGSQPRSHQQLVFRQTPTQPPRQSNPPIAFEKVSVVTYPLSYNNSPIEVIYQSELKRSVLFHSHNSNPQNLSQQKSADSGGQQDLRHIPVQPNVAVQMQYDKNKFSTPTHNQNYNTRVPASQAGQDQRPRKGSDNIVTSKNESPVVTGVERRISMQAPSTVYVTKPLNVSSGSSPFNGRPDNFRTSCTFMHVPMASTLTPPTNESEGIRGSILCGARVNGQSPSVGSFSKGSPSTSNPPVTSVKFQYQPYQQEKGRLDHIKTKTYADLVNRQSLPTEPSTDRVSSSRLSEGATLTNSFGSTQFCSSQSMHAKIQERRKDQPLQFKIRPREKEVKVEEKKEEKGANQEAGSSEPGDAFKKDKGLLHQPYNKEPTKFSPQNAATLGKEGDLKKSVRFGQYINQNTLPSPKISPSEMIQNKISPTSFTKQKLLESQAKHIGQSPQGSPPKPSESPRKSIRRQPKREDFRLGMKLGSGKYGDVYLVEHRYTGMLFALKTFSKKFIREQKLQNQFCHEIKLQSYLRHENIVQLYGYFDDAENVYLILELCWDGQLADLLKRQKRLPEAEASRIVDQLCNGVDFMHRHRIIHRDIKPENVTMQSGVVKICDFGWAAHLHDGLRDTFCGTPLYVSPQVLEGDKYGEKIDLWGIGILTYELLVGCVPFKINCQSDMAKIINEQIEFPEKVPISDRAKDFIIKLTDKDPSNRLDMDLIQNHEFLTEYRSDYMKQLYA